VKLLTSLHLARADADHAFAVHLSDALHRGDPIPAAWVIVVAYYCAVHCVNAYLWEIYDFAPSDHESRTRALHSSADLTTISVAYDALGVRAYHARYEPTFSAPPTLVERSVQQAGEIRAAVRGYLGLNR